MAMTIEQLEVEVQSSSADAESGIYALAASLTKLKTSLEGGCGLTAVSKQLTRLNKVLSTLDSNNAYTLQRFAQGLQALSVCSGIKLSSTLATNISSIGAATQSLKNVNFNQLRYLADALVPLSTLGKTNLGSFASSLQQLPQVMNALNSLDIGSMGTKLTELAGAFSVLSSMGKNNLDSFIKSLEKVPGLMKQLSGTDIPALKAKIEELANAFAPLATQMQSIANGFSALPTKIQTLITNTDNLTTANKKLASSKLDTTINTAAFIGSAMKVGNVLMKFINASSKYVEDINLFTVSMREYAKEAQNYAETVSEIVGIDPGEWMRYQGVFMTLATGFGVASERAYTMSQQLTQLGYDISSFANISFEESMEKLQSGLAGELEPLRRIGYDLSVARLQQEAYTLGIDKKVSAMTQAEKAELRYYAIMTQVTTAQGDMARTLNAPANQMRIFKAQIEQCSRALGNIFIPLLNKVLPYLIAIAKVIRMIADVLSGLVGFKLPEMDYSGVKYAADSAGEIGDNLDNATKSAKAMKKALTGIDELNILSQGTSGGSGAGDLIGGGFDFDLPTYDFLSGAVESTVNDLVEKMKEWLGITGEITSWSDLFDTKLGKILAIVGEIGLGLLAWNLTKSILSLKNLQKLLGMLSNLVVATGLTLLIDSVRCTFVDGLNLENVVKGAIGGALAGAGIGFKFGGWRGGLGGITIGIGVSFLINGITSMISEGVNFENVLTTLSGALLSAAGIVTVIRLFNAKAKNPAGDMKTATDSVDTISNGTSNLTAKLKGLVVNLGLGLVILAEVAAAALLVTGAIALLGKELELVGIAWEPVIANGSTVAIGMGIGTGVLALIGSVTYLLSKLGAEVVVDLGLGILILAELGIASGLFLVEIWGVGKGLAEIGKAWEPVLENGETIAKGIGIGTALLVGIGVVTAALGAATVATAGALPLAIGLGTALLVELAAAFVLFVEGLVATADELNFRLSPALDDLNENLPGLTENMKSFVGFMKEFAGQVVEYTGASVVAGLSGTIDTIVGWFTEDPIEKLSGDVRKVYTQSKDLNEQLKVAVPELQTAIDLLTSYNTFLDKLEELTDNDVDLSGSMYVNMKEVGENLVTGLVVGMRAKIGDFSDAAVRLGSAFVSSFTSYTVPAFYQVAKDVVAGFNNGINAFYRTSRPYLVRWANDAAEAYKDALDSHSPSRRFLSIGEDTVRGYNLGIQSLAGTTKEVITDWAESFTEVTPTMRFAVDTSSLQYYNSSSFEKSLSTEVTGRTTVTATGFKDGMEEFYREYMEPVLNQMAEDMRRQADKEEQTVVNVGGRTINDAVTRQKQASGYRFTAG